MKLDDLKFFIKEVHRVSKEHGWHDAPAKSDVECLALVHCEVSEAIEELRKGEPANRLYYSGKNKPEGVPAELADVLLRIFDYTESRNIDLIEALLEKHEFNKLRPYKHGKLL